MRIKRRMAILSQKKKPIISLIPELDITRGMPASRVPTGQSLQNQYSFVKKGTAITKRKRKIKRKRGV